MEKISSSSECMTESNERKHSKALSKLLHPFQLSRKWRFVFLILLNLVLKTAFLFVRIFPDDVDFYRATGYLLLYGSLPYADFYLPGVSHYDWHMAINSLHPNGPLNYIFYGYWMKLFGDDVWAIKLPWLISEIFISICIYMIAEDLMNQNKAFLCSLLYTIMPASYFPGIFVGCDELITSAFTVGAVYLFFKQKYSVSAILLGLGISYKLFPVFALIPVFYYFYTRRQIKELIYYVLMTVAVYLIIALPFMIINFESFAYWNFSQANRDITIPYFYLNRDAFFFQPLVTIMFVPISLYTFFQITILALVVLPKAIRFLKNKNEEYTHMDFLRDFSLLILLLPFISLSNNYRYFIWMIPFAIIFWVGKHKNTPSVKEIEQLMNIQILILIILSAVTIYISTAFNLCLGIFSTNCYNDYLSTFLLVYTAFSFPVFVLMLRKQASIEFQLYTFSTLFLGYSSNALYHYWESIKYMAEYPASQIISIITLIFGTGLLIALLYFEEIQKLTKTARMRRRT